MSNAHGQLASSDGCPLLCKLLLVLHYAYLSVMIYSFVTEDIFNWWRTDDKSV